MKHIIFEYKVKHLQDAWVQREYWAESVQQFIELYGLDELHEHEYRIIKVEDECEYRMMNGEDV